MNRYHLLLMTPTQDKRISLLADDYVIEDDCFVFLDSDNIKIAVYPVDRLAIESIYEEINDI